MSILLKKYSKKNIQEWDDFVDLSSNGTIFHYRKFLSYHLDRQFEDNSLIFEKNKLIIAVLPAAKILKKGESILLSHPGASYGGFIYNQLKYEEAEKIIELVDLYCMQNNFKRFFLVPPPIIYYKKNNELLNYLLIRNNYQIKEMYISSIIDIEKNINSLDYLNKRKKRYIKKYFSNLNLKIEYNNDYNKFYPILLNNKKKHNVIPTHTLEELKKLYNLFPKKFYLLLLYYNEKVIGGTLNIIANKKCGIMFYNMIDYKYKNLQAASIQIFESINWAKKMNLQQLDLGVSQQPNSLDPLEPHKNLIKFKEQFGATAILRNAFEKKY